MVADGVQYGPFAEGAHASSKPSSLPLLTGACCSPDFGHHVDRQRQDLLAVLHLKEVQVQRTEEEREKKRGTEFSNAQNHLPPSAPALLRPRSRAAGAGPRTLPPGPETGGSPVTALGGPQARPNTALEPGDC